MSINARKTPTIKAEAHSDDHNVEVDFDALKYFKQATTEEVRKLAACGWGGDYPGDEVAQFMADHGHKRLADLFKYIEIIHGDPSKKDCQGFERHVNHEDVFAWLKKNRPIAYEAARLEVAKREGEWPNSPPPLKFHVDVDDEQWGRVASDCTIVEVGGEPGASVPNGHLLVNAEAIKADIIVKQGEARIKK